ncbi:hypothetical protein [Breoghania sp.]|uniref:hypothetical protein n=1 Tax=Breoghania sp. TaxID=2065378 RepID=UPI0029C6323A|nr:hypothetical protein [Breoghania sp.]
MKKIIFATAMVFMLTVGIGNVAAQPVDIGTGQMDAAEFAALKAMVQGKPMASGEHVSTPAAQKEQYGELQMTPAEFHSLQNAVAGKASDWDRFHAKKDTARMVDIGTGEMPADDFFALKQMVEGSRTAFFDDLALLNR